MPEKATEELAKPRWHRSEALQKQANRASARARLSQKLGLGAILIGLAVGAVFLWQSASAGLFAPTPNRPVAASIATSVVASASVFSGFDDQQRPFEVKALHAIQDHDNENLVNLEQVEGNFFRAEGHPTKLNASKAKYDIKSKALDLSGNVILDEPGHFKASLESATVDLDGKGLSSSSPVRVDINGATVEADQMNVVTGGAHIIFKGHVRAKLASDVANKGVGG